MNIRDILKEAFKEALSNGNKVAETIHFGIIHQPDLNEWTQHQCSLFVEECGYKYSLGTELHKGMRVGRIVRGIKH